MRSPTRRPLPARVASVVALVTVVTSVVWSSSPVAAAPGNPADAVAVVIEGQGNGHGRGLSQYGAMGWATIFGNDWTWILDHYYGGTVAGTAPAGLRITVALGAYDGRQTAVVAADGNATWVNGVAGTFGSLVAREVSTSGSTSTYKVWGTASRTCPAATDSLSSWRYLGQVSAAFNAPAVRFSVPGGDDPNIAVGSLIGVCDAAGAVRHYRGSIYATNRSDGADRTINDVDIEGYLRGVIPRESPASWADRAGGAGINALRAQAVAARSYALAQGGNYAGKRYPHAKTCDSDSCQVYGGSASRVNPSAAVVLLEDPRTDRAVADTTGVIRIREPYPNMPVSTEFSSSNGDRTAGINFIPVDDDGDKQDVNPWSRWTRVLSAPALASRYGLSKITKVEMTTDTSINPGQYGVTPAWAVSVRFYDGTKSVTVKASDLRSAFGFPSSAIKARLMTRDYATNDDFVFIGDSVGASIAANDASGFLPTVLNGSFNTATYDSQAYRCTVGTCPPATSDGLTIARNLSGSPDVAIVELGYNDGQSGLGAEIDQVMTALVAKGVRMVGWVTMSERRIVNGSPAFALGNVALRRATSKWPQLRILNWDSYSAGPSKDRWFSDNVHLSPTGRAEFALWLRDRAFDLSRGQIPAVDQRVRISSLRDLRIPVAGNYGIPTTDVVAVSFNLTVVNPDGPGYMTVWPCTNARPNTSSLNFAIGQTVANSIIAPVNLTSDPTGGVCISSTQAADVVVDVNGWFSASSGLRTMNPVRAMDTRNGTGGVPIARVGRSGGGGAPLELRLTGKNGIPASGVAAVSMNLTATNTSGASGGGYVTAYPCGTVPVASNLNFTANRTVANAVVVPVSPSGSVCFFVDGEADLIVDVNGWFVTGSGFKPLTPARMFDTRDGTGGIDVGRIGTSSGRSSMVEIPVVSRWGLPPTGVSSIVINLTATDSPTDGRGGYATVYPCSAQRPLASNLNFLSTQAVANNVIAQVSARGTVCFFVDGSVHLLADISGWMATGAGFNGLVPLRVVDTRENLGPVPGLLYS